MTRQLSYGLLTIALVLLTFDSLFVSCKRYSEDDKRYWFKSPIKRLSDHPSWTLNNYLVNGSDSIKPVARNYFSNCSYCAGGDIPFTVLSHTKTSINFDNINGSGKMELVSNKNKLNITFSTKTGVPNPFINQNGDWDIQELTEKVLKISATINGTHYVLIFNG